MANPLRQNTHSGIGLAVDAPRGWRGRIKEMQRMELALVRHQARVGRRIVVRPIALALNHLGNGWLYLLLAVALLLLVPERFLAIAVTAGAAATTAHLVYPAIKRRVARRRPFEVDPAIPPLLPVLDRYSFPSGHCMTVTAVAVPVGIIEPAWMLPAVSVCVLIAWARMLAAHHYPSDVLAGIALGALAALPAILILL